MRGDDSNSLIFNEDSIDLILFLKKIFRARRIIIGISFVSFVLGIIYSFQVQESYSSRITFIPHSYGNSSSTSSLSGLASLAGINLGNSNNTAEIAPSLYPKIVSSINYRLELLETRIVVNGKFMTLRNYLSRKTEKNLIVRIVNYVIGFPRLILNKNKKENSQEINSTSSIYQLNEIDRSLFGIIEANLLLELNDKGGFISLEFSDKDKNVAAQVVNHANNLLQEKIIDLKNRFARESLDFTNEQFRKKKLAFETLQDSIAIFRDRNLNISSSLYQNKLERLNRELNLASSVLEQLASQVEQAKLQLNKDTPIFTILEDPIIPLQRTSPNRTKIALVWLFVGLFFSIGYIIIRPLIISLLNSIKEY